MLPNEMTLFELLLYARLGIKDFADNMMDNHYMITCAPYIFDRTLYNSNWPLSSEPRERIIRVLEGYLDDIDRNLTDSGDIERAQTILTDVRRGTLVVNGPLLHIKVKRVPQSHFMSTTIFTKVYRKIEHLRMDDSSPDNPSLLSDMMTVRIPIPITIHGFIDDSANGHIYQLSEYGIDPKPIGIANNYSTLNINLSNFDDGVPSFNPSLSYIIFDTNNLMLKVVPKTYKYIYGLTIVDYDSDVDTRYMINISSNYTYPFIAFNTTWYWRNRNILPESCLTAIPENMVMLENQIIETIKDDINHHLTVGDSLRRSHRINNDETYDIDFYTGGGLHSSVVDRAVACALENTIARLRNHQIIGSMIEQNSEQIRDVFNSEMSLRFSSRLNFWRAIKFIENKFMYNGLRDVTLVEEHDMLVDRTVSRAVNKYYGMESIDLFSLKVLQAFLDNIWSYINVVNSIHSTVRAIDDSLSHEGAGVVEDGWRNEYSDDDDDDDDDALSDPCDRQDCVGVFNKRYFTINSYHSGSMRTNVGDVSSHNFLSLPDENLDSSRDYIGLELEFAHGVEDTDDVCDNISEYANSAFYDMCSDDIGQEILRHFDFSHDSSLEERGAEMVSLPMSLNYIKSKRDMFDHIFNTMRGSRMMELGGFHIHLGRRFMYEDMRDSDDIDDIEQLLDVLFYDRLHIDERSPYGRARFAVLSPYILGRFANTYCDKNINFKDVYYSGGNHRNWINTSKHTVEFRMPSIPFSTDDLFLKLDYIVEGIEIIKNHMRNYYSVNKLDTIRDLRLHNIKYFKRKLELLLADYKATGEHLPNNTHVNLMTFQRYFIANDKVYNSQNRDDVISAYTTLIYVADALHESVCKDTSFDGKIETIWDWVKDLINMGIIEI